MPREHYKFLLILSFCLAAGCGNGRKLTANEKVIRVQKNIIARAIENSLLKDAQFAGTMKAGNIQVLYEAGLQNQADCIANLTYKSFSRILKSTGFRTSTANRTMYLLRSDSMLWDVSQIVWTPENVLGVILLAQTGEDSCEAIISHNSVFPFGFVHEIIEGSLFFRKEGTVIEHDYKRKEFGFINRKILNLDYSCSVPDLP